MAPVEIELFARDDIGEGISGMFGTSVVGVSPRRPIENLVRKVSFTALGRPSECEDKLSCAKALVKNESTQRTGILWSGLTINHLVSEIMTLAN